MSAINGFSRNNAALSLVSDFLPLSDLVRYKLVSKYFHKVISTKIAPLQTPTTSFAELANHVEIIDAGTQPDGSRVFRVSLESIIRIKAPYLTTLDLFYPRVNGEETTSDVLDHLISVMSKISFPRVQHLDLSLWSCYPGPCALPLIGPYLNVTHLASIAPSFPALTSLDITSMEIDPSLVRARFPLLQTLHMDNWDRMN